MLESMFHVPLMSNSYLNELLFLQNLWQLLMVTLLYKKINPKSAVYLYHSKIQPPIYSQFRIIMRQCLCIEVCQKRYLPDSDDMDERRIIQIL